MTSATARPYLPAGLPSPVPETSGLSAPYWNGLREGRLMVQQCSDCGTWQFGPEWLCHRCHVFDPPFREVAPSGSIFSWERVWHPSHPCLVGHGPYLVVLVEVPHAGGIRLVGNLLGDPMQDIAIGAAVEGVFERHDEAQPAYALLQWRLST